MEVSGGQLIGMGQQDSVWSVVDLGEMRVPLSPQSWKTEFSNWPWFLCKVGTGEGEGVKDLCVPVLTVWGHPVPISRKGSKEGQEPDMATGGRAEKRHRCVCVFVCVCGGGKLQGPGLVILQSPPCLE